DGEGVALAAGVTGAVAEGQTVEPGAELLLAGAEHPVAALQHEAGLLRGGGLHPGGEQERLARGDDGRGVHAGDGQVGRWRTLETAEVDTDATGGARGGAAGWAPA